MDYYRHPEESVHTAEDKIKRRYDIPNLEVGEECKSIHLGENETSIDLENICINIQSGQPAGCPSEEKDYIECNETNIDCNSKQLANDNSKILVIPNPRNYNGNDIPEEKISNLNVEQLRRDPHIQMNHLQVKTSDVQDIDADDYIICPQSDSDMEMKTLDESIDEAIRKHLKNDDDLILQENYSALIKIKNELKDVSVQTVPDICVTTEGLKCIHNTQNNEGNNLKALLDNYFPNKPRELANQGRPNTVFYVIATTASQNYDTELEINTSYPKRNSNNDRVVYPSPSQEGFSHGNKESIRSIRVGLSKKAKLRSLHNKN